jgi:hypothetical protein
MPKIEKENIWDLVSGNYHSCLITTYSFDFYYFEKSVMRILRSKGIGNISLFIDNNIIQNVLGRIGGNSSSRVYSISPIVSNGCFHPKVYMFFGENQGLVIIGSGNLTSSGHGKNEEIWGAFHYDINEKTNEQLFANAWGFFNLLTKGIKGFSKEKFRWIKEYSPWLDSLPTPNQTILESLDDKNGIAFFSNGIDGNIYKYLTDIIPKDDVREITIIAPYFDSKGKIIESFYKNYKNAKINILLDDKNGILPFGLNKDIASKIDFFHWNDCYEDKPEDKQNSRLHAKIFNFKLADKTQFCLIGSSNASVAAFGTDVLPAINNEVSVLLKSENKDFIHDLGIKVNPNNNQDLSNFNKGLNEDEVFERFESLKFRIEAIDKEGSILNIFIIPEIDLDTELHLFNNWGELILSTKIKKKKNHYTANISKDLDNAMYGCLFDTKTSEIISNKQLIQDVFMLSKTNPDPQKQVLDVLFSGIEQGDELLFSKLIDCISANDFNAENISTTKNKGTNNNIDEKKEKSEIKGEILDYNDFKDVSNESIQNQFHILNSNSSRVADFLSNYSHIKTIEEIASSELDDEELDVDIEDSQGREDQPEQKPVTKSAFKTEKSRIIKYFERYNLYLDKRVDQLIKNSNHNIINEGKISITELSNFVIAFYIAIYYTDKRRQFIIEDRTCHETIISSYGFDYYDNLPAINADIIGKFLLLCTRGFKTYESEYLNQRLEKLRKEAFYHCIFSIAQAKWNKKELDYKNLLLVNTLHFLPLDTSILLEPSLFTDELNMRQNLSSNENQNLIIEIKNQIDSILPRYSSFVNNMKLCVNERKTVLSKDLMTDTIIFTSRFGFCKVQYKMSQNEGAILTLSRPGFPWIDKKEEYLLEEKRLFKRNITL